MPKPVHGLAAQIAASGAERPPTRDRQATARLERALALVAAAEVTAERRTRALLRERFCPLALVASATPAPQMALADAVATAGKLPKSIREQYPQIDDLRLAALAVLNAEQRPS